jgi:hypothetical protein
MKRISVLILILIIWSISLNAQDIPHPVINTGIYEFLDELANNQIISINSAVKPYSRSYIANKLKEVEEVREQLSPRQQKELDFYLLDFGKELDVERLNGANHLRQGFGGQRAQRCNSREGYRGFRWCNCFRGN